jgi:DNA invertase Pin-like site-specific DNA recombinase
VPVDLRRGAPPVAVLLDEGEDELPAGVLAAAARAYRVRHPSTKQGRPRAPVTTAEVRRALQGRSVAAAAELLGVSPMTVRRRLGRSTRARTAPKETP